MHPLYSGGTQASAGTSTPPTILITKSSPSPPLGTIAIEPTRLRAAPAAHASVDAAGGLVSTSPDRPTVIVVPRTPLHATSVLISSITCVGARHPRSARTTRRSA